jgi:hypothetical protein
MGAAETAETAETSESNQATATGIGVDYAKLVADVLRGEYQVLLTSLTSGWSISMLRTSLFLGVLSAAGVALGFAAQAGGLASPTFLGFALVVLPVTLFLGLTTFARLVQIQRESIVYITGMNRIRHYLAANVAGIEPYLVLSVHDDELGLFRNLGTGMFRKPPRFLLAFALVQTQGIVAVISSVIAALVGLLGARALGAPEVLALVIAALVFVVAIVALLWYWQRSINELRRAIRPLFPTPPDAIDAPF